MDEHSVFESEGTRKELLTDGLFEGDTGTLDFEQRKALTALVKLRYVSSVREPETWQEVDRSEVELRCALNNLFLELVVDRQNEVAYAVQASSESANPFPNSLKPAAHFKRDHTLLLIHLRAHYHKQVASGETNVFVDRSDLVDALSELDPDKEVNRVALSSRVDKVVDDLVGKHDFLFKVAGQKDRYRVSPIIASILSLEKVKELNDEFERICDEKERS